MTINDANLRCIISIGGSGKVPHLLVSNVVENSSKVCMVIRFPADLQTDLESHNKRLQDKNSKNKMTAAQEKEALQGFDEKMTAWLGDNQTLISSQSCLDGLLVNTDFRGAFIMSSSG